jgi:hypothetical protein
LGFLTAPILPKQKSIQASESGSKEITENNYFAILNWVKTNITLNQKGEGTVSIIVNCTPISTHFGIYIRAISETHQLIASQTYAKQEGKTLAVNYTTDPTTGIAYQIYIQNTSQLEEGKSLYYYISYNAVFTPYLIARSTFDASLVSLNLIRPIWDTNLLYQQLAIQLPVTVPNGTIDGDFLDEIAFEFDATMDSYNTSLTTKDSGGLSYLLVNVSKLNMTANEGFQAKIYLSISYFDIPKIINWLVILLVFLLTGTGLTLFFAVIHYRNQSQEEIETFKEELVAVLEDFPKE